MKNDSNICLQLLSNLTFYEFKLKNYIIHSLPLLKLRKLLNNTVLGQNIAASMIIVISAPDNGEGENIQPWNLTLNMKN